MWSALYNPLNPLLEERRQQCRIVGWYLGEWEEVELKTKLSSLDVFYATRACGESPKARARNHSKLGLGESRTHSDPRRYFLLSIVPYY
jgi:hypothetical protein